MRVVKLGGSLADWDRLPHCLACLVPLGLVIVPGGGPFADQVRTAYSRWRFDQATAHGIDDRYGRQRLGDRAAQQVVRDVLHAEVAFTREFAPTNPASDLDGQLAGNAGHAQKSALAFGDGLGVHAHTLRAACFYFRETNYPGYPQLKTWQLLRHPCPWCPTE